MTEEAWNIVEGQVRDGIRHETIVRVASVARLALWNRLWNIIDNQVWNQTYDVIRAEMYEGNRR